MTRHYVSSQNTIQCFLSNFVSFAWKHNNPYYHVKYIWDSHTYLRNMPYNKNFLTAIYILVNNCIAYVLSYTYTNMLTKSVNPANPNMASEVFKSPLIIEVAR